jgi:hypothetical protein
VEKYFLKLIKLQMYIRVAKKTRVTKETIGKRKVGTRSGNSSSTQIVVEVISVLKIFPQKCGDG